MPNRSRLEYVGKIFGLKERETTKGYMYTFSVPVNGQSRDGDEELTEWVDGIIFTKERVALTDRGEAHFTASLEVKPPYGDRGQRVGFVGRFIEPVFGNVYRISKPKKKKKSQSNDDPVNDQDNDEAIPF